MPAFRRRELASKGEGAPPNPQPLGIRRARLVSNPRGSPFGGGASPREANRPRRTGGRSRRGGGGPVSGSSEAVGCQSFEIRRHTVRATSVRQGPRSGFLKGRRRWGGPSCLRLPSGSKARAPSAQPNGLGSDWPRPSSEPQRGAITFRASRCHQARHARDGPSLRPRGFARGTGSRAL